MNYFRNFFQKKEAEKLFDLSASVGVDLIEVQYVPPRPTNGKPIVPPTIHGYLIPNIDDTLNVNSDGTVDSWIEGKLTFFVDPNFRIAYGYIFDIEENRELIRTSLSTGWYKVVDKKIRDEIVKEAEEKGYETDVRQKPVVNVRKTKQLIEAEGHIKNLQDKLKEREKEINKIKKMLEETEELKDKHLKRRIIEDKPLKGIKIKKELREELLEG